MPLCGGHGNGNMRPEIEVDLPPFKEVYNIIQDYYESLPWE